MQGLEGYVLAYPHRKARSPCAVSTETGPVELKNAQVPGKHKKKVRKTRNIVNDIIWGWEAAKGRWRGDQILGLHIRRHQRSSEQVQESDFMGQCQTSARSNWWGGKGMDFCEFPQHIDECMGWPSIILVVCQTRWLTSWMWFLRLMSCVTTASGKKNNRLERTCHTPGKEHSIFNNNQKVLPSNGIPRLQLRGPTTQLAKWLEEDDPRSLSHFILWRA